MKRQKTNDGRRRKSGANEAPSGRKAAEVSASSASHKAGRGNRDKHVPKEKEIPIVERCEDGSYGLRVCLKTKWIDGTIRTCEVIEKAAFEKDEEDGGEKGFRYYVHYHDFNRRMDEWILDTNILGIANPDEIKDHHHDHGKPKKETKVGRTDSSASIDAESITEEGANKSVANESSSADKQEAGESSPSRKRGSGAMGGGSSGALAMPGARSTEESIYTEAEHEEHEGMDAASLKEHEEVTKVKNVNKIEMGRHTIQTWYFSPFPKEYFPNGYCDCLYVCEFTLDYFRYKSELIRHQRRRQFPRHPPGDEIYRHDGIAMFEVEGSLEKIYCQNLCYLAKLFLDHKTLYYDVDPFLFYVMCEYDENGYHVCGYFSKEKYSDEGYNLACILMFPPYQRKGYGNFIISFSYELSKKEQKVGSPEKPLSDLGLVSYRSYWSRELLEILAEYKEQSLSVMQLSQFTSIKNDDVVSTLQYLNIAKYWNGQHVLSVSDDFVQEELAKFQSKKGPRVAPEHLHWAPLVVDMKRDKWSLKAKIKPATDE